MSKACVLPLDGITVLDLTELLPGPYATMQLAEMGARIVKIERPGGDSARLLSPGMFRSLNRNKLALGLDLKSSEGAELLRRLAAKVDVLIEGFRPGVMGRLGLGAVALRTINPRLIYLSLTGYGQTGPLRDHPGHDMNYGAITGDAAISGEPDGPPEYDIGIPTGDMAGAMFTVVAVLGAVLKRQRTGEGQHLDVSIVDSLLSWMTPRLGAYDHFRAGGGVEFKRHFFARPGYGIYRTGDGRHIALGALETAFWKRLVKALNLTEFSGADYESFERRCAEAARIASTVQQELQHYDLEHWVRVLTDHDVPHSVVSTIDDVLTEPHFLERGLLTRQDEETLVRFPVPGLRDERRLNISDQQPHAVERWLEDFGIAPATTSRLRASGVLFDLAPAGAGRPSS